MERLDTVIVGGGQAGLATSYFLTQQGREHVVLEQASQAGNVWRNWRWDSFHPGHAKLDSGDARRRVRRR